MKKKIVSLCLVLTMAATALIGGTMAYFTDTDDETNTFTVGGVKIDLIEEQVNEDGTALENFENDQVLMPIVGSAQGEKDEFGQPVAENYIDKIVTVENTGKSDAYIRAYFAIPSALDDGADTYNAGLNILHFNFGTKADSNGNYVTTYGTDWTWTNDNNEWNYFETKIDEVAYNVYYADYNDIVEAGEITEQLICGVYLDKDVDMNEKGDYIITRDGKETVIEDIDLSKPVNCPVFAVAVQAAGFDNATEAVEAAFGANYNPWVE